jgi:hypothetical protein
MIGVLNNFIDVSINLKNIVPLLKKNTSMLMMFRCFMSSTISHDRTPILSPKNLNRLQILFHNNHFNLQNLAHEWHLSMVHQRRHSPKPLHESSISMQVCQLLETSSCICRCIVVSLVLPFASKRSTKLCQVVANLPFFDSVLKH